MARALPHLFAVRKDDIQSAALVFLFQENFRKTETAAGEFASIVVADEGDAFLADFGEEIFSGILGNLSRVEFAPWLMWLRAVFRWLIARLWLFPFFGTRQWCFRRKGNGFLDNDQFRRDSCFRFLRSGLALSAAAAAAFLIRFGKSVCFGLNRGGSFRLCGFRGGLLEIRRTLGSMGDSSEPTSASGAWGWWERGKAKPLVVVDIVCGVGNTVLTCRGKVEIGILRCGIITSPVDVLLGPRIHDLGRGTCSINPALLLAVGIEV